MNGLRIIVDALDEELQTEKAGHAATRQALHNKVRKDAKACDCALIVWENSHLPLKHLQVYQYIPTIEVGAEREDFLTLPAVQNIIE